MMSRVAIIVSAHFQKPAHKMNLKNFALSQPMAGNSRHDAIGQAANSADPIPL
jgi:hypothetical protein